MAEYFIWSSLKNKDSQIKMPKAKENYKKKYSFGPIESCATCGEANSIKNVCNDCNEVGCGRCMPGESKCKVCKKGRIRNLQMSDIR